jgi:hypothetical protein
MFQTLAINIIRPMLVCECRSPPANSGGNSRLRIMNSLRATDRRDEHDKELS